MGDLEKLARGSSETWIATWDELRLTPDDYRRAEAAINHPTAIGQYAACEFDELSDDGKTWVAAIVRAALRHSAGAGPR